MFLAAPYSHIFREGRCDSTVYPRLQNHGIETSLLPTVLFWTMRGKNSARSPSLKYFFRSTACGAQIPCQITFYHIDVDLRAFRRPVLLILLQRCRSVLGPADEMDLVSRLLGPLSGYGS